MVTLAAAVERLTELLHGETPQIGPGQQVPFGLWPRAHDGACGGDPQLGTVGCDREHLAQPILLGRGRHVDSQIEIDLVQLSVHRDGIRHLDAGRRAGDPQPSQYGTFGHNFTPDIGERVLRSVEVDALTQAAALIAGYHFASDLLLDQAGNPAGLRIHRQAIIGAFQTLGCCGQQIAPDGGPGRRPQPDVPEPEPRHICQDEVEHRPPILADRLRGHLTGLIEHLCLLRRRGNTHQPSARHAEAVEDSDILRARLQTGGGPGAQRASLGLDG